MNPLTLQEFILQITNKWMLAIIIHCRDMIQKDQSGPV